MYGKIKYKNISNLINIMILNEIKYLKIYTSQNQNILYFISIITNIPLFSMNIFKIYDLKRIFICYDILS